MYTKPYVLFLPIYSCMWLLYGVWWLEDADFTTLPDTNDFK